jgi:hypothetical protein
VLSHGEGKQQPLTAGAQTFAGEALQSGDQMNNADPLVAVSTSDKDGFI